jgi:carbon monoxide dehydrogenase subunit G
MMTIERTIEIRRPMNEIYDFVCDPSRLGEWRDGLLAVERLSPTGTIDGAVYHETIATPLGPKQVTVRLSTTPPQRLSFEVLDGPFRPEGSLELRDLGGSTAVTYRMQGPTVMGIPSPLDRVVEDLLTKNVENSVANLKRILEPATP